MVWGKAPNDINDIMINILAKMAILTMWTESLEQVTGSNYFSHVEKILNQWWQREKFIDEVQPLIITSGDDSTSEDFSDLM
jgi:hypothetical protein